MLSFLIFSSLAFSSSPDFSSCSMYPILNEKISSLRCQTLNQDYLMGFGMKYCLRFMSAGILVGNEISKINWNSTSEIKKAQKLLKFRKWVWGTMECLQFTSKMLPQSRQMLGICRRK
jgi:hypothetical protein